MFKPTIPIPEVKKSELAYHGFFDVQVDHLRPSRGPDITYTTVNLGFHAVAIIAQTTDGKFVTTLEYRHPVKKWIVGCPGGRIDPQESPLETAKRELLEETGYGGGTFSLLGSVYPLPALTQQEIFFVFAEGVSYLQPPALEPLELIHTCLKTPEELFAEIKAGALVDGVFCSGLFLWKMR